MEYDLEAMPEEKYKADIISDGKIIGTIYLNFDFKKKYHVRFHIMTDTGMDHIKLKVVNIKTGIREKKYLDATGKNKRNIETIIEKFGNK